MVPESKRSISTQLKIYRSRNLLWNVGIVNQIKDGYSITTEERTVVDCLTHSSIIPEKLGIDALKILLAANRNAASKILDVAKKLGVERKVLSFLRVLT